MKKTIRFSAIAAAAFFAVLPVLVLAQLPTATIPTSSGLTLNEVEDLIERLVRFFMAIGVVLAVGYIIWGGIALMHAGGDDTAIKASKIKIWSGVWGAVIVLAVGVILQTLAGIIARSGFFAN